MKGILISTLTGDIALQNGSFALGDTRTQTIELALRLTPGSLKEHPAIGGNIQAQLGGNVDPFWPSEMKEMLKAIGHEVKEIKIEENNIIITL